MTWIALKMLTGDRSKYFAIIFGVSFACFLIAEQSAIFCGVMLRTTSQIRDTQGADIWVMNTGVRYVDDLKAISDNDLFRVRGVPGVAWAVNLYRGQGQAQLADGTYQGVILMGLDDSSLTGGPTHMLVGQIGDLQIPDAILVDEAGFHQMWPSEPLDTGKVIEMNQRRAVVVGVYRASQTFMTLPIIYTRFSQATLFVPPSPTGRLMPFVLAKAQAGTDPAELARRIQDQTGLKAVTNDGFIAADDELLSDAHGHPRQLRHDRSAGVPGRHGHCRPDVLPVHGGKPQAVRHAQSNGPERPPHRGDDPDPGVGGRWHWLWNRRGTGDAVWHLRACERCRCWPSSCRGRCWPCRRRPCWSSSCWPVC